MTTTGAVAARVGFDAPTSGVIGAVAIRGTPKHGSGRDRSRRRLRCRELLRLARANPSVATDPGRLAAEARAELVALQSSRRRVIEAADDARRTVERNLHDGAQQSLVALLYELSLARARFAESGDRSSETVVAVAAEMTARVLDDLRRIAHGAFPRVLDDLGLAAAIQTIVERSAVPVDVGITVHDRLSAPVEHVAYSTVSAAIGAADIGGPPVRLTVSRHEDQLRVRVEGAPIADLGDLGDRIEALGGAIASGEGGLTVVLPCV